MKAERQILQILLFNCEKQIYFQGLGEEFNLQCVATTNQGQCKQNVVDSRVMIGSHLWFCGYSGFGDSISARKEGVITVFSYHDSRYSHVTVSIPLSSTLNPYVVSFYMNVDQDITQLYIFRTSS